MIGELVSNRYRIVREIGSGGMAWVYLTEDIRDGRLVAIKILYPQFSADMSYIQRFTREAKVAISLSDPHVVRVLDYGADKDIHYLVMEYIEGRDLKEEIRERGPLPYRQALEICRQVTLALEHAYRYGIIHRDIKPQNLMITADGTVKVLDFGLARARDLPSLTQSGFVGSPYYISPEQAMGEKADIRSDIYSLGIVLYEMLSGTPPYDAETAWSIISQHIAGELPPLQINRASMPQTVEHLIAKMAARRPDDRFQTPAALRETIEAILAERELPMEARPLPKEREPVAELYRKALEASQAERWQDAVDLFSQVLSLDPNYEDAPLRLVEAGRQARLAALYQAATMAIQEERWQEAVDELIEIVATDPNYRDAAQLLSQASQTLAAEEASAEAAELYAEGLRYLQAQDWLAAVACLTRVEELSPGYRQVRELLTETRRRIREESRR